MPVAKIQTPTGEIITLQVPDGATEQDILNFIKSQDLSSFKANAPEQKAPDIEPLESTAPAAENTEAQQENSIIQDVGMAALKAKDYLTDRMQSLPKEVAGGLEAAASVGSSIIAEPIAGLAGIGAALNPFNEEGTGARRVEEVRDALTYKPEMEGAKQAIQTMGETLQPAGDAFNEYSETLGDYTLRKTGSPELAAIAHTLPAATLEMIGVGGFKKATSAVDLTDINKAKTAVEKRAILSSEIKNGNINAGNIAKTLDESGNLITNKRTKNAIKLLGDGDEAYGMAVNIEKMNPQTKLEFNKMLDVLVENKKAADPVKIMENRPARIIGKNIAKRVEKLNNIKKSASKVIGDEINGATGKKVIDTSKARDNFISALRGQDIDVFIDDSGKLAANTDRSITNIKEVMSDKVLNNILSRLESGSMTAKDAHRIKRNIRELVNYDPASPGSVKPTIEIENAVKSLSSALGDSIGDVSKKYRGANKVMSESLDALKEADRLLGKRLMIGDELADSKFAALSKRIGTNLASRDDVIKFLDTIDSSLEKRGVKFNDDIRRQVAALSDLEKIFKVESAQAPFGLQSRMAQGAGEAITGKGVVQQVAESALDKFREMNQMDFDKKIKALRDMAK